MSTIAAQANHEMQPVSSSSDRAEAMLAEIEARRAVLNAKPIKLTASQMRVIQAITTRLARRPVDGVLSFQVSACEGTNVVQLCASNVHGDLRWFERTADYYAFISPRGAIKQYGEHGNLTA